MKLADFLTPINAAVTLIIALVTALVALGQTRKITHDRLDETIEDYDKINKALREQVDQQREASTKQEDKILKLSLRIGVVEGQNKWLVQQNLLMEQYVQQLTLILRRAGTDVPPRPVVDGDGT